MKRTETTRKLRRVNLVFRFFDVADLIFLRLALHVACCWRTAKAPSQIMFGYSPICLVTLIARTLSQSYVLLACVFARGMRSGFKVRLAFSSRRCFGVGS